MWTEEYISRQHHQHHRRGWPHPAISTPPRLLDNLIVLIYNPIVAYKNTIGLTKLSCVDPPKQNHYSSILPPARRPMGLTLNGRLLRRLWLLPGAEAKGITRAGLT